ncbi:GH23099 [Drosophila grimshawi]|uniref:GH23099 n=1 Tax=Drosophila grimshawi TaxID=7222 RepID=B4JVD5_DROGR|nr:GH23099 [Drosophila grimshawi]
MGMDKRNGGGNGEDASCHSRWSDFVAVRRYFNAPLRRSRSAPVCCKLTMTTLAVDNEHNPSLSWQLACNPMHSEPELNWLQVPQDKDCGQADGISRSMKKAKPRKRKQREKQMRLQQQQERRILLVDATMLQLKRRQVQPTKASRKQIRQVFKKSSLHNIKYPQNVPLCRRPTTMLGSQQQQQHYLQQQQHLQRPQLDKPLQHMARSCPKKYVVPTGSMYNKLTKGCRYCGNFYYR